MKYSDLPQPWKCKFVLRETNDPAFRQLRVSCIGYAEVRQLLERIGDDFLPHDYELLLEVKSGNKKWEDWSGSDESCSEESLIDDLPASVQVWIPNQIENISARFVFRLTLRNGEKENEIVFSSCVTASLEAKNDVWEKEVELKEMETPKTFPFLAAPEALPIEVQASRFEKNNSEMFIRTFPAAGSLFLHTSAGQMHYIFETSSKHLQFDYDDEVMQLIRERDHAIGTSSYGFVSVVETRKRPSNQITIIDLTQQKIVKTLSFDADFVSNLDSGLFSDDRKYFVQPHGNQFAVFDLNTGRLIGNYKMEGYGNVYELGYCFFQDQFYLVGKEKLIEVNLQSGEQLVHPMPFDDDEYLGTMGFHPKPNIVALHNRVGETEEELGFVKWFNMHSGDSGIIPTKPCTDPNVWVLEDGRIIFAGWGIYISNRERTSFFQVQIDGESLEETFSSRGLMEFKNNGARYWLRDNKKYRYIDL